MLRLLFIGIVSVHSAIHFVYTYHAFSAYFGSQRLTYISKIQGVMYALVAMLFIAALILYTLQKDAWWMLGLTALICSQVMISLNWQQSKYFTLFNMVILGVVISAFSIWSFNRKTEQSAISLYQETSYIEQTVSLDMISDLPEVVQKWLIHSQIIDHNVIETIHLKQKGQMRLKPEQQQWNETDAVQYFTVSNPSFVWQVKTKMAELPVIGRDTFKEGRGSMLIKLAGMIPVVDVSKQEKIDISTLQRYLGEIIWFPSAALSPYINWQSVDDHCAIATMDYMGTSGSVTFHFDDFGQVTKVTAQRYKDANDTDTTLWIAKITETKEMSGMIMPSKCEISWDENGSVFTWYKFEVYDVMYNESINTILNNK